ncbi:MAG: catalase/peroxidase HPI [Pseudomonadota bacterium]|nr:catalase/peroxidase HPI [Pseudomonadota bacterium]
MGTSKINSRRIWFLLAIGVLGHAQGGHSSSSYTQGKAPPPTSYMRPKAHVATDSVDQLIPKISVDVGNTNNKFANTEHTEPRSNDFWWPKALNVSPLRKFENVNPLGKDFNYAEAYSKLDIRAVEDDLRALMKDSKSLWPADYGHYGPFFIRMAWHSAGTYRALDGRGGSDGGQQRFAPLNSWPDNANLDKARLLLQPLVDKYYPNLSWADAMVLAGDLAMRDMGFKTLGVAGGRTDDWSPDLVYWGPEDEFLKSHRFDKNGNLLLPLAASVMGLIYVNPEGADGKPDPLLSAKHIRMTFGRMGMNDEETVALIAGGHTFGKAHGAHSAAKCVVGPDPTAAPVNEQLKGWKNKCGKGNAEDTITSGIEGAWTSQPVKWTHEYLTILYEYQWTLKKGPGGKFQWFAKDLKPADHAPDAHLAKRVPVMMLTTDLSLRFDPTYGQISRRFLANPKEFEEAFAKAWFKLIHRDMGPKSRYLGNNFSNEDFIWQDPVPAADYKTVDAADIAALKGEIEKSGLSVSDLVKVAWAAASSYRGSDMKGGVNGARIRLAPQKDWEVNEPALLQKNLTVLEKIQSHFNENNFRRGKKISFADLIILAGNVGVEQGAKKAGYDTEIPFVPGRTDATQEQTDVESLNNLKINNDGFRNYYSMSGNYLHPASAFVDRADLLSLTIPEMTVLIGGLRVLGANYGDSKNGVFTEAPGTLTNDFFINLMDSSTHWTLSDKRLGTFVGKNHKSGATKWTATTHDLIFGSNAELRVVAFTYASKNAKRKFVSDFISAWDKVMNLDRFDLKKR